MTETNPPLGPRQVTGTPIPRPRRGAGVQTYIPEIAKGLVLTMKHFFQNTKEVALGQRNDPVLEVRLDLLFMPRECTEDIPLGYAVFLQSRHNPCSAWL